MNSCLRRIGVPVVVAFTLAFAAGQNAGAALPAGYEANPADGIALPAGGPGDHFGKVVTNLGGLILIGVPDANAGEGAVVIANPVTGATRRINAPLEPSRTEGVPTNFGASVAAIPDIGACQSPPSSRGANCTPSPAPDGFPDYLVGAPGANLNNSTGVDMGRVYVLDGVSDGVMKRIQLGSGSNAAEPIPGGPAAGTPDFGRSVSAAAGLPLCGGSGGIGACAQTPARVAVGDLDGGGKGDVVIGAPLFSETEDTNPACSAPGGQACDPSGRVYVFKGEDLTAPGTTTLACIQTPEQACDGSHLVFGTPVLYPYAASGEGNPSGFGTSVAPLGDVASCDTSDLLQPICPQDRIRQADGVPDIVAGGPGVDVGTATDAGAAFLIDGASGVILLKVEPPTPQEGADFGTLGAGQAAAGDLGGSPLADMFLGAPGQSGAAALSGRGFVFDGNGGLFATADDPSPASGAGFGGSVAAVGDIAGDAPGELLIGATGAGENDVHLFSACANAVLQTISAPPGAAGFGKAVAGAGDANGDGFADFAIGAPDAAGGAGRLYVMKSSSAPGPGFAGCNPGGGGGSAPGGGGGGSARVSPGGGGVTPGAGSGGGGKKARALTKRRIVFVPIRAKVRASAVVRFRGKLKASKRKRACQSRVKITIARFEPAGGVWHTVDVSVTKRDGRFGSRTRLPVPDTYYYRASAKQTGRCAAAVSKRIKVKVTD